LFGEPQPESPTFEEVHKRAEGRWPEILTELGISDAVLDGKHHPCPGCGGKDRFRFDNKQGQGNFICSQGGSKPLSGDGFKLLIHAGVSTSSTEALHMVADSIGLAEPKSRSVTLKTDYTYNGPDGEPKLKVTRTDFSDGTKKFSQKTARGLLPTKDDQFESVPYHLDNILNKSDAIIHIVEGEKCADKLTGLGLVATCNAGGAGNWQSSLNQYFEGREVIILPDNDEAGEKHQQVIADELEGFASSIRVCRLPDLPPKGDVVDWFDAGNGLKDLDIELKNAKPVDDGLGMTLAELDRLEIETPDPVHNHLPHGFTLLAGAPKAGKSKFMEWMAFDVGGSENVLYLALEYSLPMLKKRFAWMANKPSIRLFREGDFPQMDKGGKEKLDRLLTKLQPRLTIIDTLGKIKRPGAKDGYEAETIAMSELKELFSHHDLSCVCIHHTRKTSMNDNAEDPFERILGSTALAAVPDNLMVLINDGEQTVLHTKGRLVEASVKRFVLQEDRFVINDSAGAELRGKADRQADILEMLAEGAATQAEIRDELGFDAGNLSRMCKALEANRKITRQRRGAPWQLVEGSLI